MITSEPSTPHLTSPGKAFRKVVLLLLGWIVSCSKGAGMDLPVVQRGAGSYPVFTTLSELQQHSTLVVVATP